MDMEYLRRDTSIEFEITDGHGIVTKGHINKFEITGGHGILTKGHANRIRDNQWTWNPCEGARHYNSR